MSTTSIIVVGVACIAIAPIILFLLGLVAKALWYVLKWAFFCIASFWLLQTYLMGLWTKEELSENIEDLIPEW